MAARVIMSHVTILHHVTTIMGHVTILWHVTMGLARVTFTQESQLREGWVDKIPWRFVRARTSPKRETMSRDSPRADNYQMYKSGKEVISSSVSQPVSGICRYPAGTRTSVRDMQVPCRHPDQCQGYAGTLQAGICRNWSTESFVSQDPSLGDFLLAPAYPIENVILWGWTIFISLRNPKSTTMLQKKSFRSNRKWNQGTLGWSPSMLSTKLSLHPAYYRYSSATF